MSQEFAGLSDVAQEEKKVRVAKVQTIEETTAIEKGAENIELFGIGDELTKIAKVAAEWGKGGESKKAAQEAVVAAFGDETTLREYATSEKAKNQLDVLLQLEQATSKIKQILEYYARPVKVRATKEKVERVPMHKYPLNIKDKIYSVSKAAFAEASKLPKNEIADFLLSQPHTVEVKPIEIEL